MTEHILTTLYPLIAMTLIFKHENHLGSLLKLKSKAPAPKILTQSGSGSWGFAFLTSPQVMLQDYTLSSTELDILKQFQVRN